MSLYSLWHRKYRYTYTHMSEYISEYGCGIVWTELLDNTHTHNEVWVIESTSTPNGKHSFCNDELERCSDFGKFRNLKLQNTLLGNCDHVRTRSISSKPLRLILFDTRCRNKQPQTVSPHKPHHGRHGGRGWPAGQLDIYIYIYIYIYICTHVPYV